MYKKYWFLKNKKVFAEETRRRIANLLNTPYFDRRYHSTEDRELKN